MSYQFPTTTNLCYLFKDGKVLLIMKKRGFGKDKYNGPGGKVKPGETVEESMTRELQEEVKVIPKNLKRIGFMEFIFTEKLEWNTRCYVYATDTFEGEPSETEECLPEWFDLDKIPYERMWDADKYWFPLLLSRERFRKRFLFDENGKVIRCEDI